MKITHLSVWIGTLLFASGVWAQDRMILAGDSWAMLPCAFNSFHNVFVENNLDAEVMQCWNTATIQIRASNWMGSSPQKKVQSLLKNPSVKVVYLSLGGNDLISQWHKSMTDEQLEVIFAKIRHDVGLALSEIRRVRPDVKILYSGYDYTRFVSEHQDISNYKEIYERAGRPTAAEIHHTLIKFTRSMAQIADGQSIFFIHHLGVMHHLRGNSDVGLPAGVTLAPEFISPPEDPLQFGGVPEFELDRKSMMRAFGFTDSYHLAPSGYIAVARHATQHYLGKWFSQRKSGRFGRQ